MLAVDQWDEMIIAAAEQYRVPPAWIKAVIEVESAGDPWAFNPKDPGGARGLMQILPATAAGLGVSDPQRLWDPLTNISVGAELLGDLRRRFGDDFRRVYSAYNSGRPDLWQTSSQVARNVERALSALQNYIGDFATGAGAAVSENPLVALALLAGLYFAFRR